MVERHLQKKFSFKWHSLYSNLSGCVIEFNWFVLTARVISGFISQKLRHCFSTIHQWIKLMLKLISQNNLLFFWPRFVFSCMQCWISEVLAKRFITYWNIYRHCIREIHFTVAQNFSHIIYELKWFLVICLSGKEKKE